MFKISNTRIENIKKSYQRGDVSILNFNALNFLVLQKVYKNINLKFGWSNILVRKEPE